MYQIWVNGIHPKSKKTVKDALANGDEVYIQDTSLVCEYHGIIQKCPEGKTLFFVTPHAYDRRAFGQIYRVGDSITVK